jgi:predicted ester cyclase
MSRVGQHRAIRRTTETDLLVHLAGKRIRVAARESAERSCQAPPYDRRVTIVERLVRLWTEPIAAGRDGIAAFAELYTEPVSVNGVDVPLSDLLERARALQRAFADLTMEIIDEFEAPDRLVIVFLQRGRHVGPFALPFGEIPATGRRIEVRTIDVLSLSGGRISAIQVVPDNLGMAMQLGAIELVQR